MLINDINQLQPRMVIIMSDMDILAATIKSNLREIAKQASALGTGLQNAAPGNKNNAPNNSVQYLLSVSDVLVKVADDCEVLFSEGKKSS